jgi:phytoene dehydrogenase-like protein
LPLSTIWFHKVLELFRNRSARLRRANEGIDHVDAAAVISTASGMLTFGSLIEAEQAPAAVVRQLKRLRLSLKAVSIEFGLLNNIEAPAHSVNVLPWMEYQHEIFMQDGREMKFPVYLVPTVTMPELAPRGGSIVELFYPVRSDLPLEYWDEERKSQITKAAIDALSRSHKLSLAVTGVGVRRTSGKACTCSRAHSTDCPLQLHRSSSSLTRRRFPGCSSQARPPFPVTVSARR